VKLCFHYIQGKREVKLQIIQTLRVRTGVGGARLPFASMEGVRRTRLIGGGILVATGLVWIGQGTALIRSASFMTGDPFWAWVGLAAVVVGIGLIAWSMRARSSR
jgi:hypothetical protein